MHFVDARTIRFFLNVSGIYHIDSYIHILIPSKGTLDLLCSRCPRVMLYSSSQGSVRGLAHTHTSTTLSFQARAIAATKVLPVSFDLEK
jgi:hypothetical protein